MSGRHPDAASASPASAVTLAGGLVAATYAYEVQTAGVLHEGLNLADMAHLLHAWSTASCPCQRGRRWPRSYPRRRRHGLVGVRLRPRPRRAVHLP